MSAEPLHELIDREAVRATDLQQAAASELRGRAALLIATASISISLLGESAFGGRGAAFAWVAFAAFVLVCASALAMTWPRTGIVDSIDIRTMVRSLTDLERGQGLPTTDAAYGALTSGLASHQRQNAELITYLSLTFRIGSAPSHPS